MIKGRGTGDNPPVRFHEHHVEAVDDGWLLGDEEPPRSPETVVRSERARSVISRNRSPDVPFDQSLNPYRGCEHGCIYCFARPKHAYIDLSPGLDFETRLFYKANAAEVLAAEFSRKGYVCSPIVLGTSTDPYQPIDREYRITRQLLEVCWQYRHPVHVITKGAHLERDLDLYAAMAEHKLVSVSVSLTTLDADLKRRLEPRAASAWQRLRQIRLLSEQDVPVSALVAPVIPILTDPELERLLQVGAEHGARSAGYVLLRLPREVEPLFQGWLREHYPGQAERVLSRLREAHGGRLYNPKYGQRMRGSGEWMSLLRQRYLLACRRFGLNQRELSLDTSLFRYPGQQMGLF
ncbi:MAG: PA0069 family radical SAM protein [Ectothiorhodospiraceae bacterium]|nr:PA0069 family radical SAM protein [Ectothiorhodospiraceae bacterium]MCH8506918.1 PA0069 family radical SAM protein [Ectothiorhodospiraceae bacterium]